MGFAKYLDIAAVTAHYSGQVLTDTYGSLGSYGVGKVQHVGGEALEALGTGTSEVFGSDLGGIGSYGEELADRGRSRSQASKELFNDTVREAAFLDSLGVSEWTPDGQVLDLTDHRRIMSPLPSDEGRMLTAREVLARYTQTRLAGDLKSAAVWRDLYDQLTLNKAMTGSGTTGMLDPVTSTLSALESGSDIVYETEYARPKSEGDEVVESDRTPEDKLGNVKIQESVLIAVLGLKFGSFVFQAIKAGNAAGPAMAIISSAILAGSIADADAEELSLLLNYDPDSEMDEVDDVVEDLTEEVDPADETEDEVEDLIDEISDTDEPEEEPQDDITEETSPTVAPKRDYNVVYDTSEQFQRKEGVERKFDDDGNVIGNPW